MTQLPPVMTTDELAELLRCSVGAIKRYVFTHQLQAVRIGKSRRFRAEDVMDFLANRPVTAKSSTKRLGCRTLRRRASA